MKFLVILLTIINVQVIIGQDDILECNYNFNSCDFTIYNPNGFDNYTDVMGEHLDGHTDDDVQDIKSISGSITSIFPSIVCKKFKNVLYMNLERLGIQKLGEDCLKNCAKLESLNLNTNKLTTLPENLLINQQNLRELDLNDNPISELPKNVFKSLKNLKSLILRSCQLNHLNPELFESLENLKHLNLNENQIENLPKGIFAPLKKLNYLELNNNRIKIIYSESFGMLPLLEKVILCNNQIFAIDERFIDNIGVNYIWMNTNVCVDTDIPDNTPKKRLMHDVLRPCYENFQKLLHGIPIATPTAPKQECSLGDVNQQICKLTEENKILAKKNEELEENLKNLNKIYNIALEDLHSKITKTANRPCLCSSKNFPWFS